MARPVLPGLLPGTSLFSFPAPISPTSPRSLSLWQAHAVRWTLDSTFLRADLFPVAASTRSHSEARRETRGCGDADGGSGRPPWGPGPSLRDQRARGRRKGFPSTQPALGTWTASSPTLCFLLLGEQQTLRAPCTAPSVEGGPGPVGAGHDLSALEEGSTP